MKRFKNILGWFMVLNCVPLAAIILYAGGMTPYNAQHEFVEMVKNGYTLVGVGMVIVLMGRFIDFVVNDPET